MLTASLSRRALRAFLAAARLRCPVCGVGRLFDGWFRMAAACPACETTLEREEGFFQGSIYVGYAATLGGGICIYGLLAWRLGATHPAVSPIVLGFTLAFPFLAWRWTRATWLALDQILDPRRPGRAPRDPSRARDTTGPPTTPRRS